MIVEGLSIPRYDAEPLLDSFLPYGHQVIARETIQNRDEFFLFVTAPTGSGKTDSWAIPALSGGWALSWHSTRQTRLQRPIQDAHLAP